MISLLMYNVYLNSKLTLPEISLQIPSNLVKLKLKALNGDITKEYFPVFWLYLVYIVAFTIFFIAIM